MIKSNIYIVLLFLSNLCMCFSQEKDTIYIVLSGPEGMIYDQTINDTITLKKNTKSSKDNNVFLQINKTVYPSIFLLNEQITNYKLHIDSCNSAFDTKNDRLICYSKSEVNLKQITPISFWRYEGIPEVQTHSQIRKSLGELELYNNSRKIKHKRSLYYIYYSLLNFYFLDTISKNTIIYINEEKVRINDNKEKKILFNEYKLRQ